MVSCLVLERTDQNKARDTLETYTPQRLQMNIKYSISRLSSHEWAIELKKFQKSPKDSKQLQKIPKESEGGIKKNPKNFQTEDFKKFKKIPKSSKRFKKIA